MVSRADLSAVCPCKCESGMKRRRCSNTEENVPTFVTNYARLWGFHSDCYWGPRNTYEHRRELEHFLTELMLQVHWLQDDFSGCTYKWCKSVKSTWAVRLQFITFYFFLFTFASVHARCLVLHGTTILDHCLFPVCIFLSFITK